MNKNFILTTVLVVVFAIVLLSVAKKNKTEVEDKGATGEAHIGVPFNLTSQKGEKISSDSFKDKYMLVFFGFTHCPDICPTGLANMTGALEKMEGGRASEIAPIFITVDPERDDPKKLSEFLKNFHTSFTGLTGTKEEIDAVQKGYKVYSAKVGEEKGGEYMMDHSAFIYLMDRNGKYIAHFPSGEMPDNLANAILNKINN